MLGEKKPVTKREILCFQLYEVPRVVKLIDTQSRMVVARAGRAGEKGSCCLMGTVLQFFKKKKF